jgi:hypothetical protein
VRRALDVRGQVSSARVGRSGRLRRRRGRLSPPPTFSPYLFRPRYSRSDMSTRGRQVVEVVDNRYTILAANSGSRTTIRRSQNTPPCAPFLVILPSLRVAVDLHRMLGVRTGFLVQLPQRPRHSCASGIFGLGYTGALVGSRVVVASSRCSATIWRRSPRELAIARPLQRRGEQGDHDHRADHDAKRQSQSARVRRPRWTRSGSVERHRRSDRRDARVSSL